MESKMSGNQDIMYLLRLLEEELNNSKKAMFGGGKVVDANKCLAIIHDIKFNLPPALTHANAVVRERDKIMRDAKDRADQLLQDAEDKANTLIDNHEIIAKAKEEADYIVANAKSYADMITNETLSSIDDMLRRSEDNFLEILDVVRNSRDDVDNMRKPEARAPEAPVSRDRYDDRRGYDSRDSRYDDRQADYHDEVTFTSGDKY